ncbi:hypothetical protein AVEN_28930-1 [Araneus ventricosus]|uniref:Uncharacterized protein n=1 Tax=Araneus ventricosus TaxID=182803 RepID=A0A4Y2AJ95_ARAVE|nr:hypothetical protein AVEN_28930-1 [Araneus ventricosus]
MTRTAPEPPLQASAPHQREDVWLLRINSRATAPIHLGSSVESGFEPGILWSRSRDLTTTPPGSDFLSIISALLRTMTAEMKKSIGLFIVCQSDGELDSPCMKVHHSDVCNELQTK